MDLVSIAKAIRRDVLMMSHTAKTAHVGGSLSVVDMLVALYWTVPGLDPATPTDRLIFSKGHCVSALYATLARRGYFPVEELQTYNAISGRLPEETSPFSVPGVIWATGSLGHALSVGLGMARADPHRHVYVILGDGECQEGQIWEAAMLAGRLKTPNLTALIDANGWQGIGRTGDIMQEANSDPWRAFGWVARDLDGNDPVAVHLALESTPTGAPRVLICHTTKGAGVSFMAEEPTNLWHYRTPNDDELDRALAELA